MLGKLFAYEWKATWKVPVAICIYLGALTLLGCFSFISPIWNSSSTFVEVLAGFSILVYVLSLIGACIAIFVYFVVRFYKNMYSNEGYLMHTLPVKAYEHIVSKGLIFLIWSVLSCLIVIGSVILLFCTVLFTQFGGLNYTFAEFMHELSFGFNLMMRELQEVCTIPIPLLFLIIIFYAFVSLIAQLLQIYASISIGQTFKKYKVMASIVAYIGLNFMLQFISTVILIPNVLREIGIFSDSFPSDSSVNGIFSSSFYISLGISFACCIVFYILTEHIMRKKLNLD